MSKKFGELVVRDLFGAVLADQGRGFYVGLEFLAIARGTLDRAVRAKGEAEVLPPVADKALLIDRRSHDFARRLMSDPRALTADEAAEFDTETLETLAALARGLRVPIPGSRRRPPWHGEHLQPYVGELIHYDAVFRKARKADQQDGTALQIGPDPKRVSIERYLYRGAGGLAHAMLRSDESERGAQMRSALLELVRDSGSPLGDLFRALSRRDRASNQDFKESAEFAAAARPNNRPDSHIRAEDDPVGFDDRSPWVEQLRAGALRIAQRNLPRAKRIEALMHWIPYCIARYQADVARRNAAPDQLDVLAVEAAPIPVDFGNGPGPIRRRSREIHDRIRAQIVAALDRRADRVPSEQRPEHRSNKWRDAARSFFSGTMAAIGGLNATTGKRYFVLGNELLESLLLATVDHEVSFETFCRSTLFETLGLVVDKSAASRTESLRHLNRSDFDTNAEALADRLDTLGMLVKYSDKTRMVRAEVGQ